MAWPRPPRVGRLSWMANPPSGRVPACTCPLNAATLSRMPRRPKLAGDSSAVVGHVDDYCVMEVGDQYMGVGFARVTQGVGERFLNHPIRREVQGRGQRPRGSLDCTAPTTTRPCPVYRVGWGRVARF